MQLVRLCSEKGFDPETAPKGLIDRLCAAANVPTLETLQAHLVETERQVAEIFRDCSLGIRVPNREGSAAGNSEHRG
jgi:hypothetical protein